MTTAGLHELSPRLTEMLAVLAASAEPLSTTDIRLRINENRSQPLVAEQVYRGLRRLAKHGYVDCVRVHGTPKAHWTLAEGRLMLTVESAGVEVFDWALRAAPAAGLDAAGMPDHAHRILATPQLTNHVLGARPAPLRPHTEALLAAHRDQYERAAQQAPRCVDVGDPAQLLNPMWRVLTRVRRDLVAGYGSRAGQYAQLVIATALATDEQQVVCAVTDTYRRLLDSSPHPLPQPTPEPRGCPEERHTP